MNQIVDLIKKVTKAPLTVTYVEKSNLKHLEDMESSEFIHEHLGIEVENSQFQFAALDNSKYPDFKFSTLSEFLVENHSPNDKN
ncbi:hypothetical protein K7432_017375 [Basidiobolus ranarum]|uniref:NADH dehydrogenase subunit 9 n=1 Tax=Basidiobolus ranarum TaxID=34480 RepID=A0ABR2VKG0_9FUNG